MKLADARKLQKEMRGPGWGFHCIVPVGHGPDGYFCRIFGSGKVPGELVPIDFTDRAAAVAYNQARKRRQARAQREYLKLQMRARDRRSPLDRAIDQACGLEGRKD